MKVLIVNHSDINGGAARAANRLHQALKKSGIKSQMLVSIRSSDDPDIRGSNGRLMSTLVKIRSRLSRLPNGFFATGNPGTHSPMGLTSCLSKRINSSDADIVHLHWINNGTLSIGDIARIRKPIVWTFHDMWAFCGAEHYTEDDRWKEGYQIKNRPPSECGVDINRLTWNHKVRSWRSPIHVVCPSRWIGACVARSPLTKSWPATVIPNAIDVDKWKPGSKRDGRLNFGVSVTAPVILFGAIDSRDPRKGFELLVQALYILKSKMPDVELMVMGRADESSGVQLPFKVRWLGHVADDEEMRSAYCAADVFAIPSRQDNLPNTAIEAHACGLPVVGFNIGGLPDIVEHQVTGYLANPFDIADLAIGLEWVLQQRVSECGPGVLAHRRARQLWSEEVVSSAHLDLYRQIVEKRRRS